MNFIRHVLTFLLLFATLPSREEVSDFVNDIHDEFIRPVQLCPLVYDINALTQDSQENGQKEINYEEDVSEEVELCHKRVCIVDLIKFTLTDHTDKECAEGFENIIVRVQVSPEQEIS